jgi:hypothetical protein
MVKVIDSRWNFNIHKDVKWIKVWFRDEKPLLLTEDTMEDTFDICNGRVIINLHYLGKDFQGKRIEFTTTDGNVVTYKTTDTI